MQIVEPIVVHIRPPIRIDGVLRSHRDAIALINAIAEPRLQNLGVLLLIEVKERILLRVLRINAADVRRKAVIERLRKIGARIEPLDA